MRFFPLSSAPEQSPSRVGGDSMQWPVSLWLKAFACVGVAFLVLLPACTTTTPTRSYRLNERLTASAGSSMLSWTASNGLTKEFIFAGREGAVAKLLYREYRKGEPKDLGNKEIVFAVAENYSGDSEIYAVTLLLFENLELRVLSLDDQSITYQITRDHSDAE